MYKMMKEIDPYHLTAGALECGEMHAFQEPHLSLDVPMRENYRPDLPFHANDGVHAGGSDGALRMPPMTFEPMMNMADAVRLEPGSMSTCTYLRVMRVMMSVLTPVLSLLCSYAGASASRKAGADRRMAQHHHRRDAPPELVCLQSHHVREMGAGGCHVGRGRADPGAHAQPARRGDAGPAEGDSRRSSSDCCE